MGQPCQKHPSMKIANRARTKTISTVRVDPVMRRWCNRNRNPQRWSRERSATSLALSRCRVLDIRRVVAGSTALAGSAFFMNSMNSTDGGNGDREEGEQELVILPANGSTRRDMSIVRSDAIVSQSHTSVTARPSKRHAGLGKTRSIARTNVETRPAES